MILPKERPFLFLILGNQQACHNTLVDNLISSSAHMVRCNVSKASYYEHVEAVNYVRNEFKKHTNKDLLLMLDIAWPKDKKRIWIENEQQISCGETVFICMSEDKIFNNTKIIVDFDCSLFNVGEEIYLGNAEIILTVTQIGDDYLQCVAKNDGLLKSGLGIASKQGFIKPSAIDIKDKCVKLIDVLRPECIVLSYIETSNDVIEFKELLQYENYNPIIMSKIECYSAIKNIDAIIDVSDEIMIARGCLAINVGLENLLFSQDLTLNKCIEKRKKCC
ncbi:pyruvate kinase [Paenibacillus donghaensis]|uniref:pyruvate kinase n=1 Tax=Paenibacillus donghaensis TaxID=414771 RepID=UPI0014718E4C|nr:pyruvate kinase [Paenibacillus donghaensis]